MVAVGGTTLTRSPSPRGWRERTWNDPIGAGGSGCSAYVRKPSWQHDRHCPGRTVADVSAVATNVPIFEATYGGWVTVEGTSISAPLIAGIYGLAGNGGQAGSRDLYQHTGSLFDVTRGNNAFFGSARPVAATTTSVWPARATTRRPGSAPPTGPALSSPAAGTGRPPLQTQ